MTDTFISYSRQNTAFVRKLHATLLKHELSVWVDWEGIPPSAEWLAEIYQAIDRADCVIFVISAPFCASQICQQELEYAHSQNKRLIPIVIEELAGNQVAPALADLNWLFFRETDDFDRAFTTLLSAINTDLAWVRTHTTLLNKAQEWQTKANDNSLLLRGKELGATAGLIADNQKTEPMLTSLQQGYMLASKQYAVQRRKISVLAALLLLAIISVISWFAYQKNKTATIEQARVLAGKALQAERGEGIPDAVAAAKLLETVSAENDPLIHNTLLAKAGHYRFEPRAKPHDPNKHKRISSFGLRTESIVFTADNKLLATSSREEVLRRWSLCLDQADNALCDKKPAKDLIVSIAQKKVAIGVDPSATKAVLADGKQLKIYSLADEATIECSLPLPIDNISRYLTLSNDAQWAAIHYGSRAEKLKLVSTRCDNSQQTAAGFDIERQQPQRINAAAFSPDSKTIYFSQSDGTLHAHQLTGGKSQLTHTIETGNGVVQAMQISPNGRWLAFSSKRSVDLIDLQNKSKTSHKVCCRNSQIHTGLQFNHASTQLAVFQKQSQQRQVLLLDIRQPENMPAPIRFNIPYKQHSEPNVQVKSMAFSHDDKWLAAGLSGDNYDIMLWPLTNPDLIKLACSRMKDNTQCMAQNE